MKKNLLMIPVETSIQELFREAVVVVHEAVRRYTSLLTRLSL
jgi:cell division GTPase FtsZ